MADGATHPVDTIRTRLWMQGGKNAGYRYNGLWHGFCDIVKKEGVRSLYKGFGSVALLTPVAHGLYFGSYEWAKKALSEKTECSESGGHLIAGFFANGVGAFIWNPMDVVKQKQQAMVGQLYTGPLDGLRAVWMEGGLSRGLLRGYCSGMATYGPFSAIYFGIYEQWKKICAGYAGSVDSLHTGHYVAGGTIAGTVAAAATSPIDLIKTRIQVDNSYTGIASTAARICREEGFSVFMRGVGARVVWVAPGCAITIAVFEDCKKVLMKATGPDALLSSSRNETLAA